MATNVRGIFAAGDVRHQLTKQITTAVGDGTTAVVAVTKLLEELQQGRAQALVPGEEEPAAIPRRQYPPDAAGQLPASAARLACDVLLVPVTAGTRTPPPAIGELPPALDSALRELLGGEFKGRPERDGRGRAPLGLMRAGKIALPVWRGRRPRRRPPAQRDSDRPQRPARPSAQAGPGAPVRTRARRPGPRRRGNRGGGPGPVQRGQPQDRPRA